MINLKKASILPLTGAALFAFAPTVVNASHNTPCTCTTQQVVESNTNNHGEHGNNHEPHANNHEEHGNNHEPHANNHGEHGNNHEPHTNNHEEHGNNHEPHVNNHDEHTSHPHLGHFSSLINHIKDHNLKNNLKVLLNLILNNGDLSSNQFVHGHGFKLDNHGHINENDLKNFISFILWTENAQTPVHYSNLNCNSHLNLNNQEHNDFNKWLSVINLALNTNDSNFVTQILNLLFIRNNSSLVSTSTFVTQNHIPTNPNGTISIDAIINFLNNHLDSTTTTTNPDQQLINTINSIVGKINDPKIVNTIKELLSIYNNPSLVLRNEFIEVNHWNIASNGTISLNQILNYAQLMLSLQNSQDTIANVNPNYRIYNINTDYHLLDQIRTMFGKLNNDKLIIALSQLIAIRNNPEQVIRNELVEVNHLKIESNGTISLQTIFNFMQSLIALQQTQQTQTVTVSQVNAVNQIIELKFDFSISVSATIS